MPISLAKIAKNTAKVTFKWGDDDVNITYIPGKVTEKVYADLLAFQGMEKDPQTIMDGFNSLSDILIRLIKEWDVLNDDGSMYPLTPEALSELPIFFRMECVSAITGDVRPEQIAPQATN